MVGMNWRDLLKIHPSADLFPQMTPSELKALGDDIKANGMRVPITLLQTNDDCVLLDGRNRLDALVAAGYDLKALFDACRTRKPEPQLIVHYVAEKDVESFLTDEEVDPYEYVVSVNINRRHLTSAQKSDLIAALLKAQPERSDRAIAKIAKVDNQTVAAKRKILERGEEIPHHEKRIGSDGTAQPVKKKTETKHKATPRPQDAPGAEPSKPSAAATISPPLQHSETEDASQNAVSMRIPRDPKKAAAFIVKRWSVEHIRDLINALAKYAPGAAPDAT